jgi:hypothetical protein
MYINTQLSNDRNLETKVPCIELMEKECPQIRSLYNSDFCQSLDHGSYAGYKKASYLIRAVQPSGRLEK